jgi:ankyrin repeat protein
MYVVPPVLLALAGACGLIALLTQYSNAGLASSAGLAALWLTMTGCGLVVFSLVFGLVRRWSRQREVASKNKAGETRLMSAAKAGSASLVKVQLARGAEVNEKDEGGQTALMKAAENGHAAVVQLLLAGGAEVNEKDKEGQTALMKAQAEGHAQIVRMLESAGAWK